MKALTTAEAHARTLAAAHRWALAPHEVDDAARDAVALEDPYVVALFAAVLTARTASYRADELAALLEHLGVLR